MNLNDRILAAVHVDYHNPACPDYIPTHRADVPTDSFHRTLDAAMAATMHACTDCGTSDERCLDNLLRHTGKACCGHCFYTDTHNLTGATL